MIASMNILTIAFRGSFDRFGMSVCRSWSLDKEQAWSFSGEHELSYSWSIFEPAVSGWTNEADTHALWLGFEWE